MLERGARRDAGRVYDALATSKPLDLLEREVINKVLGCYALRERVAFQFEQIKPALAQYKAAWSGKRSLSSPEVLASPHVLDSPCWDHDAMYRRALADLWEEESRCA
ncbi:hypothetical protein OKW34_001577 [Paraburkholderia youngii]|uniref:hypothetical protein n=1 Tax=Paraburkholderia youngii TaxID=2782701 RepID=UPI003D25E335